MGEEGHGDGAVHAVLANEGEQGLGGADGGGEVVAGADGGLGVGDGGQGGVRVGEGADGGWVGGGEDADRGGRGILVLVEMVEVGNQRQKEIVVDILLQIC